VYFTLFSKIESPQKNNFTQKATKLVSNGFHFVPSYVALHPNRFLQDAFN
jgi:hypothetical protein